MNKKERKGKRNPVLIGVVSCMLLALLATGASFGVLRYMLNQVNFDTNTGTTEYQAHYAFIAANNKDSYWTSVYEAAKEKAEEGSTCVELVGEEMAEDFSVRERMQIAIASGVDGILLYAGDEDISEELAAAKEARMPVVTMLGESSHGSASCFVGVNSYVLGKNYGKQINKLLQTGKEKICVLLDSEKKTSEEKTLINGIQEELKEKETLVETRKMKVSEQFEKEEIIRGILLEKEAPDILVCLSASDTIYAYQSAVDYNRVGRVSIIGSYVNDEIQEAMDKGIISSAVTVYSEELGTKAIEALNELLQKGVTNEYQTVDCHIVAGGVK